MVTKNAVFMRPVAFRKRLTLSTKERRRRNGTDPDIDFESGAADCPARCPCAGVSAMAGPAHPLDGCLGSQAQAN